MNAYAVVVSLHSRLSRNLVVVGHPLKTLPAAKKATVVPLAKGSTPQTGGWAGIEPGTLRVKVEQPNHSAT